MEYTVYKNNDEFCWADNINIKYYNSLAAKEHSICEKNVSINRKIFLKLFLAVDMVSNVYTTLLKLSVTDVETIVVIEFENEIQLELFNKDTIIFKVPNELIYVLKFI